MCKLSFIFLIYNTDNLILSFKSILDQDQSYFDINIFSKIPTDRLPETFLNLLKNQKPSINIHTITNFSFFALHRQILKTVTIQNEILLLRNQEILPANYFLNNNHFKKQKRQFGYDFHTPQIITKKAYARGLELLSILENNIDDELAETFIFLFSNLSMFPRWTLNKILVISPKDDFQSLYRKLGTFLILEKVCDSIPKNAVIKYKKNVNSKMIELLKTRVAIPSNMYFQKLIELIDIQYFVITLKKNTQLSLEIIEKIAFYKRTTSIIKNIKNNKTIGIIIPRIYNGGIERVAQIQIQYLLSEGYKILLFTYEAPHSMDYDIPYSVLRFTLSYDLKQQICILEKQIEIFKIDIFYLYSSSSYPLYLALFLNLSKKYLVFSYHSYLESMDIQTNKSIEWGLKIVGNLACLVTTVSRVDMLSWQLKGVRHCVYIPNPLTFPLPSGTLKTKKKYDLLFVGRIEITKGIFDLIHALVIVKKTIPTIKLAIIGSVTENNDPTVAISLEQLIKIYDLENNVDWIKFNKDPSKFYKESRIFCSPSHSESWSMVYSEAKAFSLASIICNYSHLELFDKSDSLGFEVGDQKDLANKILYLMKNPEICEKMSKAARQNIQNFQNYYTLTAFEKPIQMLSKGSLDQFIENKLNKDILANFENIFDKLLSTRKNSMLCQQIQNRMIPNNILIQILKKILLFFFPLRSKRRIFLKKTLQKLHSYLISNRI